MSRHGPPPAGAVSVELEIPFHDVDSMDVVWHGHCVKYLEIARTALMRSRGIDRPQVLDLGLRLYVAETHLRHLAPLRYGERVRVDAWLLDVENRVRIGYLLRELATGRVVAEASTVLVTTTAAGELLLETPPALHALLAAEGGAR